MSSSESPEVLESRFKNFAEFLFSNEDPPESNSLQVDIDYQDDSQFTDFLYDLFCYGFYKKFEGVALKDITEDNFNIIRNYIRALGADSILLGHETDNNGMIVNVKIGFKPYYE